MTNILELSLEELFPNILTRQYFFVYQDESVYMASVCLIPSIEVYVDGVIVIDDSKPIGRIGSKHILSAYYELGREAFYKQAKDIMGATRDYLIFNSLLRDLLEDFKRNKVGFTPILDDGIIAVASIYDILRVITKFSSGTIADIGSRIITIDADYSIKDAIRTMLDNNIRRLFIKEDNEFYAIVGRDILGFIMENEVGSSKPVDITNTPVGVLAKHKMIKVAASTSIKDAAVILLKQHAPSSLIMDGHVITPLDIIMSAIKYK
jgi:predicted transcriptional regulator